MPLVPYDPELDDIDPVSAHSDYDSDPQDPLARTAELPDTEQDWTEVHPNGSKSYTSWL